jgi:hypothetical protein
MLADLGWQRMQAAVLFLALPAGNSRAMLGCSASRRTNFGGMFHAAFMVTNNSYRGSDDRGRPCEDRASGGAIGRQFRQRHPFTNRGRQIRQDRADKRGQE